MGSMKASSPEEVSTPVLKWLLLQKESQLVVQEEANDILKNETKHVNVAMVCGRLRTGKSYLMNCLLSSPSCFEVSSQARSFTKGVDLCSRLVEVEEMGGKKGGPRVAFVDLEGQGDKGLAQDLKIATPCLIVSKVVLLVEVCPTGPSSEYILESLQLMMMAGNCVAERKDRRGLFGCLHVVLRDCAQDEAECRGIIFDHEDENAAETDQHAEAMRRRNQTRKAIELSFEAAPKVWCLPKLAGDVAPEDYRLAEKEGFAEKVDEIRNTLAQQLSEPKLLDGKPLTGGVIATLMPELAEAMRSDEPALNPPNLVARVAAMEVQRAVEDLLRKGREDLDATCSRLPLSERELQKELEAFRDQIVQDLAVRLAPLAPAEGLAAESKEDFSTKVDALCQSIVQKNNDALEQKAEKIQSCQRTEAEKLVGAICLPLAAKDLEAALEIAKAEALEKLDASLVMLTPKLAERTKQGVYCHILELVEDKRKANAFALHRRRTRLATLSLAPLLCIVLAFGIILAGQPADCDESLAVAGLAGLIVNPMCWRHIPEVQLRKAENLRRQAEEAAKSKLLAERERLEEARLEAIRREEERAEREAHENRQLALTGLGSIGLAWALLRRDLAWFR